MRKTRLLSILALLLMAATGAWAQDYYAPSADEVIILNDVYDDSNSGYSSHSAIAWGGSALTSNKRAGDPNNGGVSTSSTVNCYSVKGTGQGKNITLSITGVSKVIVYHERNTRYIELRDGSKNGNIIGSGKKATYYTEVELTATNKYSIFLHGTSNGSDDQDLFVYAIKLIAAPAPATVAVTGVTLDKTTASMTVGGNALTLTATVAPDDATDKTVTWTTSDASVATVANGVVTAKAAGTATITATATNGTDDTSDDKTATCTVTVRQPITTVRSWNFTKGGNRTEWASAQAAATSVWSGPDGSFRYSNANNLSEEELTDGTNPLKGLAGIYFTAPAGSLLLGGKDSSSKCLQTSGNGISILLVDCAAKDRITLRFCASVSDETVTITSDQMKSSYVANSKDRSNEASAFVKENGNVVLNVPSKVRIYEIKVEPYVAVTNFNLSAETVTVAENRTVTVSATGFSPSNAFDKTLEWTTADENVATVANGVITGVNPGTTTITVTSVDGPSKTIGVTVQPTYTVTLAEGTEDAANWTIEPNAGLNGGETVTITYNGTKRIQSITAVKKAGATAAEGHALSASAVGEIVGSDGKAYAVADKDNLPQGVTAVAMIAYVGTASDCAHGLAIALADESGTKEYEAAGTACSGKAAVTGGTWRLPSIKDWQYMFIGCGASGSYSDDPSQMSYSGLASKLTTAQGDALQNDTYWSSTPIDDFAWFVGFDGSSTAYFSNGPKDTAYRVRACLAF